LDTLNSSQVDDSKSPNMVSVPPNAFYVPSPVLLLSTLSRDGIVDVSTMSAVGVVCLNPAIIAIGIKPRRVTYRNIRRTEKFVVSVPLEGELWSADYVGTRSLRLHPNKIAESGLTINHLPKTGLPYVENSAVVMACKLVSNLGRKELKLDFPPSHQVVIGQITECIVDPQWLGEDEMLLEQMPLLLYLNRVYAARGSVMEEQRFTDDPDKRREKMREYRSLGKK